MMRREIAVEARAVVQGGDLARLADLAERFERAMDGRQRDMRMPPAYGSENGLGARMVSGREQRLDNRESLRRDGESAIAAALGKLGHPLTRIGLAPVIVDDLEFHPR